MLRPRNDLMHILHLDSSVAAQNSLSRLLTAEVVASLEGESGTAEVRYRDLAATPLGHYTAVIRKTAGGDDAHSPEQRRELEVGEEVLDEFLWADVVVVGAPMYNFTVPTQLKVWIDHICVAGKTFRYTPSGAVGLCWGKRVIIVSTRGGKFTAGSPVEHMDFQEKYLAAVFAFLGLSDVEYVRAEGVAYGPEARDAAVAQARRSIADLTA